VGKAEQVIEQQVDGAPDLVNLHQDVRVFLQGYRRHVVAEAALVIVMLAADARRYGKPPVTVRVRRSADGGWLRVEVDDHSPAASIAPNVEDYRITLLDRMTSARGVDRHDGVTTTWAEIQLRTEAMAS
jgi:hypothetical protein